MRTGPLLNMCQDSGTWNAEVPSCDEGIEKYALL